jgi:hypothetical protein
LFADVLKVERQQTHGARLYPSSSNNSSIVVATTQFKKHHNSLMVRFYNWRTETTVSELRMKDTRHAGMGPQDIFSSTTTTCLSPIHATKSHQASFLVKIADPRKVPLDNVPCSLPSGL